MWVSASAEHLHSNRDRSLLRESRAAEIKNLRLGTCTHTTTLSFPELIPQHEPACPFSFVLGFVGVFLKENTDLIA